MEKKYHGKKSKKLLKDNRYQTDDYITLINNEFNLGYKQVYEDANCIIIHLYNDSNKKADISDIKDEGCLINAIDFENDWEIEKVLIPTLSNLMEKGYGDKTAAAISILRTKIKLSKGNFFTVYLTSTSLNRHATETKKDKLGQIHAEYITTAQIADNLSIISDFVKKLKGTDFETKMTIYCVKQNTKSKTSKIQSFGPCDSCLKTVPEIIEFIKTKTQLTDLKWIK
ncbi:MAG: hypothetical protein JXA53_02690 [Bacteroidales bacterium]|nr:hypothetical protein [Bacteroidales bacterium]